MKCLLSERLYVPASECAPEVFDDYTYRFRETKSVTDSEGRSHEVNVKVKVTLFKPIKGSDGLDYFGFARGNDEKLKKYFGHLEWVDARSAPRMKSGLIFNPSYTLKTWDQNRCAQVEAITDWLRKSNGVLRAPPRFGKTVCAIYLLTTLGYKTLIVTHQKDLLDQFYKEFLAATNLQDLLARNPPSKKKKDATGHIVGFFNDFKNPEELDVCLLSYQKFASKYGPQRISKYKNTWGLVIVDECHASGAYRYASIVNSINAKHRLGLSGTVERTDLKEQLIFDILGPVAATGKVEQVPARVMSLHTAITVDIPTYVRRQKRLAMLYLCKKLAEDPERLGILVKVLDHHVKAGRSICIGFHPYSAKQIVEFTEMLQSLGYNAKCFNGQTIDREDTLNGFRTGEVQVAVCNTKMLTGINVPRWNTYYNLFPTGSVRVVTDEETGRTHVSGNYMQQVKRPLTPFKYEDGTWKKEAIVVDFVDDDKMCEGMYAKRQQVYDHEGFAVTHVYRKGRKKLDEY